MFCTKCGKNNDDNAKFCTSCGAIIQQNQNPVENIPGERETTQHSTSLQFAYQQQEASIKNIKKKGLKWWKILLIILGIFFAMLVIIGIVDDGNSKTGTNSTARPSSGDNYITDNSNNDTPTATSNKTKTVMIYLVGSDLESQNGAASADIIEMMESGVDTDQNNILIYTGGTKEWAITDIPVDKNCIYLLENDEFELVKDYNSANMGSSQTLAEFITYSVDHYAADEYGLILWNHGAGPLIGYGVDELHGDLLEMAELQDALMYAGFGNGKKLEFLGFDACLMGCIETAWGIKEYADYFIASQETEPGTGWDYSFLKQLNYYDSGEEIGKSIIDHYFSSYEQLVAEYPRLEADLTLSCLDLSKIDAVETSLNNLFAKVDSNILSGSFSKVSKYRNNVKAFGKFATSFEYDLIDISHMVSLLSEDYSSEAQQLNHDLENFVCYAKSNVRNANGVSIYHPYDNEAYMSSWISSFKSIGFAHKYAEYITDFGTLLSNPSSSSWKSFGDIQGLAVKNGTNNELTIQLTEEQVQNYAGSNYFILKKINDDEYMFIFSGIDAELGTDGILSATYNNKAVFAVNDKTNEASDAPITMYQVRDGGSELKYYASAIFWLFADNIEDWRTDPVEWQIKIEDGNPMALGAFLIDGANGAEIPQKQLLDYTTYSMVEFSFSTRIPKRDASGNILPYFEWDTTGNFYGSQFEVADGFHLECREIDDKDDYYVMFVVHDVQGNSYASDMFPLPQ